MKGLKYLFTVPNGEKVTERHMVRVLISSVCGILLSMACLVSTTWAWFTVSITSADNQIEVGTVSSSVEIITAEGQSLLTELPCTLEAGSYQIRITNTGNTRGYFGLGVTDNTDEAKDITTATVPAGDSVTVELTVRSGAAEISIMEYWGESSETAPEMSIIAGLEPVPETEPEPSETPGEDANDPTGEPETPGEDANDPTGESETPGEDANDPTGEPETPGEDASDPTEGTETPVAPSSDAI